MKKEIFLWFFGSTTTFLYRGNLLCAYTEALPLALTYAINCGFSEVLLLFNTTAVNFVRIPKHYDLSIPKQ